MIPTLLLVDPEMILKEFENDTLTWDCGLLFCSLLKRCNPVIYFYSYKVSNKRELVSFQSTFDLFSLMFRTA